MGVSEIRPVSSSHETQSIRKSRRLSPFAFHTPSRRRRASTLKFDTRDYKKTPPITVTAVHLSRESSFESLIPTRPEPRFSNLTLWWTSFLVGAPILGFTAAFLGFVCRYRLTKSAHHPFNIQPSTIDDNRFIFVDFSATRLTFIASWSSTLAPMLLGSLMALWHQPTVYKLAALTKAGDVQKLPTPHQLSMLVGLSTGSIDELRKYFLYRINSVKASQPALLSRSVWILVLSSILAALIFAADSAIHAFTSTVPYTKSTIREEPILSYGRGLIDECIDFNRTANQGLPCTVIADASVGANSVARDSGEIISLGRNVSSRNTIWTVESEKLQHGDLLILMPQTTKQFRGHRVQCYDDWGFNSVPDNSYVVFNCTDNFRGVLGASPDVANDTIIWTQTDSTTPNFNVKSDRNFQYAYFTDPELTQIYNSIGASLTNNGSSGDLALPENRLINPIYLATAGLVPVQNGPAGESLIADKDVLSLGGGLIAYSLSCTVTSYDVAYTWLNGYISSFNYTPTTNGSIIELAHGMQAEGMPSLSQSQSLASLSDRADGLARSFANSHSDDSLTLIASVMSQRKNILEATSEELLVAKMSIVSFVFLIVSNLMYVIFGAVLVVRAWMVNSPETRDMSARLSVAGFSAMAFEDIGEKRVRHVEETKDMFEESRIGDASRKIGLKALPGGRHVMVTEQPRL